MATAYPQENELQKMLSDEKIRSDEHKSNYLKVKAQYSSLHSEFVSLQDELHSTIESAHELQEKNAALLDHVRKELANRCAEIEELKLQLPSEQTLQVLKSQISDDLELVYKTRLQRSNDESEALRQECNKYKYEISFMKAEYEHSSKLHAQQISEAKLRQQAEVANLRKERESLLARLDNSEENGELQRIRVLQRQNAQLNLKVKGLLTELEEIRAQREHAGIQADNVTRVQIKQLTEHQNNIRTLETELSSARQQNSVIERELMSVTSQHTSLMEKIHSLQKENSVLKNHSEQIEHQSKLDVTNCKMQALKDQGEIERHRDRLINENQELKSQIEVIKHSLDQQKSLLIEKERENVKQVQSAREEEWQKLHAAENEKLELETHIQELQRRKIDLENERQAERVKHEDKMSAMLTEKDNAEKETVALRAKLQKQDSLHDSYERVSSDNAELKSRFQRLETEYNSYISSEAELIDTNQQLQRQVQNANQDRQHALDDLHKLQQSSERTLNEQRNGWCQEKLNLQRRLDELDVQLEAAKNNCNQLTSAKKKKKQHYVHIVDRLKDRITLLQAKLEQTLLERDTLKKSVPPSAHILVKKQLNDLLRRHREYHNIITTVGDATHFDNTADFTHLTENKYHHSSTPLNQTFMDNDHMNLDLANIKERLNILDDNQQQQLDELHNITRISQRESSPDRHSPGISPRDTDKDRETEKRHRILSGTDSDDNV